MDGTPVLNTGGHKPVDSERVDNRLSAICDDASSHSRSKGSILPHPIVRRQRLSLGLYKAPFGLPPSSPPHSHHNVCRRTSIHHHQPDFITRSRPLRFRQHVYRCPRTRRKQRPEGTTDNDTLDLTPPSDPDPTPQWIPTSVEDGTWTFKSVVTGKFLSVEGEPRVGARAIGADSPTFWRIYPGVEGPGSYWYRCTFNLRLSTSAHD